MNQENVHGLAVCAGIGAESLGLKLAYAEGQGSRYRTVGYIEREAYAASVLVARMEDKALDTAPIWDDLTTFDGRPYRGKVDLISAGLPCQPYSQAGKRKGNDDERAIWPEFMRIVEEVEPALVLFENVTSFLKHFEPAYNALRDLGFELAPPVLHTAAESGAPHIRRRAFILAAHPERLDLRHEPGRLGWSHGCDTAEPDADGEDSADADGERLEGWGLQRRERTHERIVRKGGHTPSDSDRARQQGEWGGWLFDRERTTLRHDADGCSSGCRICGTIWEAESPILRVDDGPAHRMDELRSIGNAVVPQVVASAYRAALGYFL